MNAYNPIDILFGGMEKLGPGSNVHTLHVLGLLPKRSFRVIVDAGCGTGRQTMVLAKELGTLVHGVDSYEPFLNDLLRRAEEARIGHLVQTHCMDMKNIPDAFPHIDLLWSEGAAYNIGFSDARLPEEAWVEGYYDVLEPRAKSLADHPDSSVRNFAVETIKEIEIFRRSEESYAYVFYVLQRV